MKKITRKKTIRSLAIACGASLLLAAPVAALIGSANDQASQNNGTTASAAPVFTMSKTADTCQFVTGMDETKYPTTQPLQGVLVNLSSGGTATMSEVVDFEKLSGKDPLMEFYLLPTQPGVGTKGTENYQLGRADCKIYDFIISDVYDESNYITFQYRWADDWFMYAMVSSRQNTLSGWSYELKADGTPAYRIISNGRFGTGTRVSTTNVHYSSDKTGSDWSSGYTRVYFDYEEKAFYVECKANERCKVLDLDDSTEVPELWEGFSDGKAKVTLQCSQYTGGSPAQILFTKLNGKKVESNEVTDEIAPDVLIDYEGYTQEELPRALVNTPYPLLQHTSRDSNNQGVSSAVKVLDSANNEVAIANGAFVPTAAGVYTVVYTATDTAGNISETRLQVTAADSIDEVKIGLNQNNLKFNALQGERVYLPDCSASSGSGRPTVEKYVIYEGSAERTPIADNAFIAEKAGKYLVQYLATDYLGRTNVYHYTVNVAPSSAPIYVDEVLLPKFVMAGKTYDLPMLEAKEYASGTGNLVTSKIEVAEDGGARRALDGTLWTVSDNATEAIIYYVAEANGARAEKSYEIPVLTVTQTREIDGEEVQVADSAAYFVCDGATAENASEWVEFSFNEGGLAEFINPVNTDTFKMEFEIPQLNALSAFHIYITDKYDETNVLKCSFFIQKDKVSFSLNNGVKYVLKSTNAISLAMNGTSGVVKPDGYTNVIAKSFLDGGEFTGFSKKCAYVRFEAEGVKDSATVNVSALCGQQLYDGLVDVIAPTISLMGSKISRVRPGEDVVVRAAVAYDVLDSYVNLKLSVYQNVEENGLRKKIYVTSADGVQLKNAPCDREYLLSNLSIGSYSVEYSAEDSLFNDKVTRFALTVYDNVAPNLSLDETPALTGKVGEAVSVPTFTATDNVDGSIETKFVYLYTASGHYEAVKDNSFTPTETGIYKVVCFAFDAAGNMGTFTYNVNVSA